MGTDRDRRLHEVTTLLVELFAAFFGAGVVLLLLAWLTAAVPLLASLGPI